MKQHDENLYGMKISPHSPNSVLRKAIEAKILLLKMSQKKWEKVSDALSAFGIITDGKSPERIAKELQGYAQRELCPYNDYLRIDTDDFIIDDQGKKYTPSNAPRNEAYLKSILFWMANSEWIPSDNQNGDTKKIWSIEDWPKISADLFLYSKLKKRSNVKDIERDVRNLKSPAELFDQIKSYAIFNARANRLMDKADELFKGKFDEAEVVFESSERIQDAEGIIRPKVRIIHVKTEAASRAYGRDTRWCTAYQDQPTLFNSYRDNLFIFHLADGRRAQLYGDEVPTTFIEATEQLYQNATALKDTQDSDISLFDLSLHSDVEVLNFIAKMLLDKVDPESFFGHIEKISGVSIFTLPPFARGLEESSVNISKYIRRVADAHEFKIDVSGNLYWGLSPQAWWELDKVEFYSRVNGCKVDAQVVIKPCIESLRKSLSIATEIKDLSLEYSLILLKVVRGDPDLEKEVVRRITNSKYSVSEEYLNSPEEALIGLVLAADRFEEIAEFLQANYEYLIEKACILPNTTLKLYWLLKANSANPLIKAAEAKLLEDLPKLYAADANTHERADSWKSVFSEIYKSKEEQAVHLTRMPEMVRALTKASTWDSKLDMYPIVLLMEKIRNNEDYLAVFKSELIKNVQNLKREVNDGGITLLTPLFMVVKLREIDPKLADFFETELASIAGVEYLKRMIIAEPDKFCIRVALYNNLSLERYKGVFADVPELIKSKALRSLRGSTEHATRLFYGSREQPYRVDDIDTEYIKSVCEKGDEVLARHALVANPYLDALRLPLEEMLAVSARNKLEAQSSDILRPLNTKFTDAVEVIGDAGADQPINYADKEIDTRVTAVPIAQYTVNDGEQAENVISDQFNLAQADPPKRLARVFKFVSGLVSRIRGDQSHDNGEKNEPKPPR